MQTSVLVAALVAIMLTSCTAQRGPAYSTSWQLKFADPVEVIATSESVALVYGKSTEMLSALDMSDGRRLWAKPMMPPPDSASVSGDAFAITQSVGGESIVTALDATSGSTAWQRTVDGGTTLSIDPSGDVTAWVGDEITRSDLSGVIAAPSWGPAKNCTIVDASGEGRSHLKIVVLLKCDASEMSVAVLSDHLALEHLIKVAPTVQWLAKGGGAVGVNDVGGGWIIDTSAGRAVAVPGTLEAQEGMELAFQEASGALIDVRADVALHASSYLTLQTSILPLVRIEAHLPDGSVASAATIVGQSQHLTRVNDDTYLFEFEGKGGSTTLKELRIDSNPQAEPTQTITAQPHTSEAVATGSGQKLQVTNVGTDNTSGKLDTNIVVTEVAGGPELAIARLAIAATDSDAVDAWRLAIAPRDTGSTPAQVSAGSSKVAGSEKTTWAQSGRCLVQISHDNVPTQSERSQVAAAILRSTTARECSNG